MLTFFIGLLTVVLVLDCLLLILLVLIQLPKKEAGAGMAFGGGATDALFGAGSGNALTKITKYAAAIFFVLAVALSVLNAYQKRQGTSLLEQELRKQGKPAASATIPLTTTNLLQTTTAVPSQSTNKVIINSTAPPTTTAPAPK